MSALRATELPRLARDASELRGRRAARWIRESTPGQLDRWGPPSQRRMQDTAIEELGLMDTGLAWTVGRSGWSGPDSMDDPPATRTPEFRAMLAAAEAGAFDVLLVGYTARYMRDLALALTYRRWFHRQGVVVYICDDRILTSNAADWERFVDKCKAAEINSREQSRNVRAGYAAKRESHRDPGGHPPFGFRRAGDAKVIELDPERIGTAVRAYELAATGLTDREVAGRLGLGLHTVRGILTSPLYRGRLRDGSVANWDRVVDDETWQRVADLRAARNRRSPGRPRRAGPMPCRCSSARPVAVGWSATRTATATSRPASRSWPPVRPVGRCAAGIAGSPGKATAATNTRRSCRSSSSGFALAPMTSTKQRTLIRAAQVPSLISSAWHGSRRSASGLWPHIAGTATRSPSNRRCATSTRRRLRRSAIANGPGFRPTRFAGTWSTCPPGGPTPTPTIDAPWRRRSSNGSACSGSAR